MDHQITGVLFGQDAADVAMNLFLVIAVLVGATLYAPASDRQPSATPAPSLSVAADVAVFRALLTHDSLRGDAKRPGLVVTRDIGPWPSWVQFDGPQAEQNLRRSLRKPAPSTIDAFLRVLGETGELPEDLERIPGIVLVLRSELQRRLERSGKDYWRTFARTYPRTRGIVSLSRIAYSTDGQEAMAYLAYSCGLLCGHGLAVVLHQVDGQWVAVEHMYLWES